MWRHRLATVTAATARLLILTDSQVTTGCRYPMLTDRLSTRNSDIARTTPHRCMPSPEHRLPASSQKMIAPSLVRNSSRRPHENRDRPVPSPPNHIAYDVLACAASSSGQIEAASAPHPSRHCLHSFRPTGRLRRCDGRWVCAAAAIAARQGGTRKMREIRRF